MNSIPLIKGNTPQEINTSIIALKKALSELEAQDRLLQGTDKDVQNKIKQINELIEGINTHLGTIDTHLATVDGQITALQPVDTVTSGNMHSVTSNAVSEVLKNGMYVGSCVIWNEPIQLTGTQDITVLGAYSYGLIDFLNVVVPIGFHLEYTISAQVTTGGNAYAYAKINNIGTESRLTWSGLSFRVIAASQRFRETDIILEPTFMYTATPGTNLHLCSLDLSGDNNIVSTIYGVTLTCFLVKD